MINNKLIWEGLIERRKRAIEQESARENFLTKHCNIIYQGLGREVYLGVDLAISDDNCSVSMVSEDDGKILGESIAFIPEGRMEVIKQLCESEAERDN